jgi:hypothetical protein
MRWNKADRVPVLIKEHLARKPGMEPCDLYKLIYQGVRGSEHLISSPEAFTERLVKEWRELDFADGDPLWESIRPDGNLLRLNLRPFKARAVGSMSWRLPAWRPVSADGGPSPSCNRPGNILF